MVVINGLVSVVIFGELEGVRAIVIKLKLERIKMK